MHTKKSIFFLLVAVFAIALSAIFSIGVLVAHKLAVSESDNVFKTHKIILSNIEYNLIHKTNLGKNVFEIEYHGDEYDVYRTEFITSKSRVVLWVKKDGFENFIRHVNKIVFNSKQTKQQTKQIALFNFYFFEELDITIYGYFNKFLESTFLHLAKNYSNFLEVLILPPQL